MPTPLTLEEESVVLPAMGLTPLQGSQAPPGPTLGAPQGQEPPGGLSTVDLPPGAMEDILRGARSPEDIKEAVRLGAPILAGIATGGVGILAQAGAQGGTAALLQAMGLEEPSGAQVGWATGLPLAFWGLGKTGGPALRWVGKHLPGAAGALHEEAAASARALPELIKLGARSADELDALLAKMNPRIDASKYKAAAAQLQGKEALLSPGNKDPSITRLADGIVRMVDGWGGQVPFKILREELKRLNARLAGQPGIEQGAVKRLRGALKDALEDTASANNAARPAVATLKAYVDAFKRETARGELKDMVESGIRIQQESGATMLNARKILEAINKDTLFQKSMGADELSAIRHTLTELNRIPALPPPRGAQFGSALTMTKAGTAGGLTYLATGNPYTAALVGSMTPAASLAVSRLLMSEPGRKALLSLVRKTGPLFSPETIAVLAGAARYLETELAQGGSGEVDLPRLREGLPSQPVRLPSLIPRGLRQAITAEEE